MSRRWSLTAVIAVLLSVFAVAQPASAQPAHGADNSSVKPVKLASSTVSIEGPDAKGPDGGPVHQCIYSTFNCGVVVVNATFKGLNGRSRETHLGTDLQGTAKVTTTYGCADANGTRVDGYNAKVTVQVILFTRRSMGFNLPATGNEFSVTTYGALYDHQPTRFCPRDTAATVYKIRATDISINLVDVNADIPNATYPVPGSAVWRGAVPAPVPA